MTLVITGAIGTVDMVFWYIGWGGIADLLKSWFKDDINFAKKVAGEMKKDGYLDSIKIYFARKYYKLDSKLEKIGKAFKIGTYFGVFASGVIPAPGFRVLADFLCGTTKWRSGLFVLCLGNAIKTAVVVFSWGLIFIIWEQYRTIFSVLILLILLSGVCCYSWRYLKKQKETGKSP